VAESTALLKRRPGIPWTQGSNPCLSASTVEKIPVFSTVIFFSIGNKTLCFSTWLRIVFSGILLWRSNCGGGGSFAPQIRLIGLFPCPIESDFLYPPNLPANKKIVFKKHLFSRLYDPAQKVPPGHETRSKRTCNPALVDFFG
jgi:hypothetical protein